MAPGSKSAKKSKTPGPQGQNKANIMKRKAFSEGGPTAKSSKKFVKSDIKNTKSKTPQKTEVAPPEKVKLIFSDEPDSKMKQTPAGINGKKMKTPKSSGKHTGIDELVVSNTPNGKGFTGTPKSFGKKGKTPKSSGKGTGSRVDDLVETKTAPVTPKGKGFTPKFAAKKAMSEGAKMKRPQISQNVDRKVPQSAGGQSKKQAKGVKKEDLSQVKLPFGLEDDYDDEDEDEDFDMDEEDEDVSDDSGSDEDDSGSDDDNGDDIDEEDSESNSDESEAIIDENDDDEDESSESDEEITFKPSASSSTKKSKTPKIDLPSTKPSEETKKPSKTPKSALKTPGTSKSTNKKVSIMLTSPENEKPSSKKVVTTPHPSLSKKKMTTEDSSSELDDDPKAVMQELSFGDDDEDDEDYEEEEDSEEDDSEGEDDVEEEDSEDDDSEGDEEENMKGLSKDLKAVMESLSFEDADEDDDDEEDEEEEDDDDDDVEEEDFDEEPEDEDVDSDDEDLEEDSDEEGSIEADSEEGTVKSQTGKRKLKTSEEDGKPPKKKVKKAETDTKKLKEDDRYYYHVGNLPPNATKNSLRWFLAESDILVKPEYVYVKNEQLTRVKGHHGKKVNKQKMHRYAVISLSSKEAAQKLHELNGIEYPATSGKWRDYELAIYPLSHGPKQRKAVSENQFAVHISNLNYNTTDENLKDLFMKRGMRPTRVWIVRRGLQQVSRGFGFARLRTRNEQLKATKINGIELDDFKLKISKAKVKNEDSDKRMHAYPYFIGSNLDAKDEKKKAKKARKNKVKPRKYQKRNKNFSKQTSENPEEGSPKPEAGSEKMNSPENKVPNGELKRKSNEKINKLRPTFGKRPPHPKQGTPKPESGSENMNSLDKKGPSGDLKGKPKGPRSNFKGKPNRNFDEKKAKPRKKKWLKGPPSKKSTTEQV